MARDQLRSKANASKGNDYGETIRQNEKKRNIQIKVFIPCKLLVFPSISIGLLPVT